MRQGSGNVDNIAMSRITRVDFKVNNLTNNYYKVSSGRHKVHVYSFKSPKCWIYVPYCLSRKIIYGTNFLLNHFMCAKYCIILQFSVARSKYDSRPNKWRNAVLEYYNNYNSSRRVSHGSRLQHCDYRVVVRRIVIVRSG